MREREGRDLHLNSSIRESIFLGESDQIKSESGGCFLMQINFKLGRGRNLAFRLLAFVVR